MLSRSLRPLTSRAASLATNSFQSNPFVKPSCVRTLATATPVTSEPTTSPAPSETKAPSQLPYFVGRSNLNNLSVYHKKKRGGNLKLTLVKNGEGDLKALKEDIKDALKLPDGDVSVNSVTKHIVIRGHKRDEVVTFLRTMGF
ncbi:mitochondrial large subunit ribosomal protein-domain-containing protein [Xylariaceae sp. FL1651]|nr:mitochondrial large subunit ribosomal protein-domain-containing protein [Xylariaceae sp. FL1651]